MMMNRVIRASLQRAYLCHSSFSSKPPTTSPRLGLRQPLCVEIQKPFSNTLLHHQTRTYNSEMCSKPEFEEGNILRILRKYESKYAPPSEPVTKYESFTVEDRPGEQWIRLTSNYGEKEDITIDVTMLDRSFPAAADDDFVLKAGDDNNVEQLLHINLIVDISKRENDSVLEFVCSAWPNYLKIQKVFMLRGSNGAAPTTPYMGPDFKDLATDRLRLTLREFLVSRGITNGLVRFLHEYMMNKDQTEFIRWMGKVKSFIEK